MSEQSPSGPERIHEVLTASESGSGSQTDKWKPSRAQIAGIVIAGVAIAVTGALVGALLAALGLIVFVVVLIALAYGAWLLFAKLPPKRAKAAKERRRGDIRRKTQVRHQALSDAWTDFVGRGPDEDMWRIRDAVARQYVEQELSDLEGRTDLAIRDWTEDELMHCDSLGTPIERRPVIVTNFLRYSGLVKAAVGSARHEDTGRHARVLCVTTITMPLTKWFNFRRQESAHPEWNKYLDFLRTLVRDHAEVILVRVILVRADRLSGAEKKWSGPLSRIKTEDDLRAEAGNWIWRKMTHQGLALEGGSRYASTPLNRADREVHIRELREQNLGEKARAYLARLEEEESDAFLILNQDDFKTRPADYQMGQYERLGVAFAKEFHTHANNEHYHAYYSVIDPDVFVPDPDSRFPPPPTDLFYVAKLDSIPVGKQPNIELIRDLKRKGLFCLAAKPDEELNMVYLSLVDPQECPENFANVIEPHVDSLLKSAVPLQSLS